jgi:hypothetical protein
MSEMQVMDPSGHTSVKWSAVDDEETEVAKATFDAMTARGYRAFHITGEGGKGRRMTSFDPAAEAIILIPHLVGG